MKKLEKWFNTILIVVCLSQTAIVSYNFFSNFGTNLFWSIFYGIIGITFDIVSVYLLAFDKRKTAKILAYCLVTLSIVIFGAESYSQAPTIQTISDTVIEQNRIVNENLTKATEAIIDNMNRNEIGYGTALSRMTESLLAVVEKQSEVIQEVALSEATEQDKRIEIFVLIGQRFNANPKALLIWFLFIRGLLLEVALVVLSNKVHYKQEIKETIKKESPKYSPELYPNLNYDIKRKIKEDEDEEERKRIQLHIQKEKSLEDAKVKEFFNDIQTNEPLITEGLHESTDEY